MTNHTLSWHIKRTLILGVPMVFAQIMQMLIGVTDTLMVARLGELPLAQITLGTGVMFFAILTVIGIGIPMSPILGAALARKDDQTARRVVRMGAWQALMMVMIFIPAGLYARSILSFLGQNAEVIEGAGQYIDIAIWALPFIFVGNAFRNYLQALERTNMLFLISVIGVIVNFIGNYALIFGKLGAPELGMVGSAWATLFTNIAMFFATLAIVVSQPLTKRLKLFQNPFRADWGMFWRLIRLGVPSLVGLLSETSLFQASILMMGWIGVTELAAFGLVLQIASLTFMIPLGFSIVASVRVSQMIGHHDREGLMHVSKSSTIVILVVMCTTAFLFIAFPKPLIGILIDANDPANKGLVALGVIYLAYAAAFQVFDGLQVAAISVLRGMQDMLIPAILAFIAYWGFGVVTAYWLGFHSDWQGEGIWMGLVIGLGVASFFLWARFYQMTRPARLELQFAKA